MVIRSRFPVASYEKYFILFNISKDYKTLYGFFINSEINKLSYGNRQIKKTQVEVKPRSYDYLDYPKSSYIDCLDPYEEDFFNILNTLIENPSKICEQNLTQEHIKKMEKAISQNTILTKEEKNILLDDVFTIWLKSEKND